MSDSGTTTLLLVTSTSGTRSFWHHNIVACYLDLWHNIFLAPQHCCLLPRPLAQYLSGITTLLLVTSTSGTIYFWQQNIVACYLDLWHNIFLAPQHCCLLPRPLAQYISGTTTLLLVTSTSGTISFWHHNIVACYLDLWHNIFLATKHCCLLPRPLAQYLSGTTTLLLVTSTSGTRSSWSMPRCDESQTSSNNILDSTSPLHSRVPVEI